MNLIVDLDFPHIKTYMINSDVVFDRYKTILDISKGGNNILIKDGFLIKKSHINDKASSITINTYKSRDQGIDCVGFAYYILTGIRYEGEFNIIRDDKEKEVSELKEGDVVLFINHESDKYHFSIFIGFDNDKPLYMGKLGKIGTIAILDKYNTDIYLDGPSKMYEVKKMTPD